MEFVKFHDRTVLKVSGNYNAAFNADMLTQNERANHVLDDVVVLCFRCCQIPSPIIHPSMRSGLKSLSTCATHSKEFGYEGKEILAVVLDKADVPTFLNTTRRSTRQEIIDRSPVYLDGKEFGLALGEKKAFDVADLDKSESKHPVQAAVLPEHSESKPAETAPAAVEPKIASASNPPVQAVVVPEAPPAKSAEPAPASKDTDIRLAGLFPDPQRGFRLPKPVKPAAEAAASAPARLT